MSWGGWKGEVCGCFWDVMSEVICGPVTEIMG